MWSGTVYHGYELAYLPSGKLTILALVLEQDFAEKSRNTVAYGGGG